MTTLTEAVHAAEFMISEANPYRSREKATVASGQNLRAGQIVQLSGTELVAYDNTGAAAKGILWSAVDASDGAVANCTYLARDAEVNRSALYAGDTSPSTTKLDAGITSLALLGIITRTAPDDSLSA